MDKFVAKDKIQKNQKTTQKIKKKKGRKKWTPKHEKILRGAIKLFKEDY